MKQIIQKLIEKEDLSEVEMQEAIHFLLHTEQADAEKSAILALLRSKTETLTELHTCLTVLRTHMHALSLPYPVIDFVGTGGDQQNAVNISTASALLAAACGEKVLKHGNRAVSSLAGSADVLAALGVDIHLSPEQTKQSLEKNNFAFCFAPDYHPLLKNLAPLRKQIKVPTTINLLGPLLNPAEKVHLILGVSDPKLVNLYAALLVKHNTPRSIIVHGQGLDELSCLGPAQFIEIYNGQITQHSIAPESLGLTRCSREDLAGQDAAYNAAYIKQTFSSEKTGLSDTLIFNAAMGLHLSQSNLSLGDAVAKARSALHSGKAEKLLDDLSEA